MKFVAIIRDHEEAMRVGVFSFESLAERWALKIVNEWFDLDLRDFHQVREAEMEFGNEPDDGHFKRQGRAPVAFAVDIYAGRTDKREFFSVNS